MGYSQWSGAPLPERSDIDDVPGTLNTLMTHVDPLLVNQASSISDRDSRFLALPKGSLVVTTNDSTLWVKQSNTSPSWSNAGVYDSKTTRATTGFLLSSGWDHRETPSWRVWGPLVQVTLMLNRTGADLPAAATGANAGDIANVDLVQLPNSIKPERSIPVIGRGPNGVWGCQISSTGKVTLMTAPPGAVFATDHYLHIHAIYMID